MQFNYEFIFSPCQVKDNLTNKLYVLVYTEELNVRNIVAPRALALNVFSMLPESYISG